jgi:hypothetical protein
VRRLRLAGYFRPRGRFRLVREVGTLRGWRRLQDIGSLRPNRGSGLIRAHGGQRLLRLARRAWPLGALRVNRKILSLRGPRLLRAFRSLRRPWLFWPHGRLRLLRPVRPHRRLGQVRPLAIRRLLRKRPDVGRNLSGIVRVMKNIIQLVPLPGVEGRSRVGIHYDEKN